MKVWVLGGTGMLGFALHGALGARGHTVLSSGRDVDITDRAALEGFADQFRPTHFINAAGHTAVDLCETDVERATALNAIGPGLVAEVARARGLPALHVSTDYVFPGDGTRPYTEDDATGPVSVYGKTKLEGEQRFLSAGGAAVVRTSWLYGPRGKSFPQTMLKLMSEREELRVVADQRGRPTFTFDLADALVDVLERELRGVFHWANAGETTWHGFAEAIRAGAIARGLPMRTHTIHAIASSAYPTPAKRPAYSVLSTDKIERALGLAPRAWQRGLDSYLDAVKDGLA
jgi:dTDP-4-dehydrorhamnose reductase